MCFMKWELDEDAVLKLSGITALGGGLNALVKPSLFRVRYERALTSSAASPCNQCYMHEQFNLEILFTTHELVITVNNFH